MKGNRRKKCVICLSRAPIPWNKWRLSQPSRSSFQLLCSIEPGSLEVGSLEVGFLEVGSLEVGFLEVGSLEVGSLEVSSREVGSRGGERP